MVMLSKVAVSTTTSILEVSRGGKFATGMWSCLSASSGGNKLDVGCSHLLTVFTYNDSRK